MVQGKPANLLRDARHSENGLPFPAYRIAAAINCSASDAKNQNYCGCAKGHGLRSFLFLAYMCRGNLRTFLNA